MDHTRVRTVLEQMLEARLYRAETVVQYPQNYAPEDIRNHETQICRLVNTLLRLSATDNSVTTIRDLVTEKDGAEGKLVASARRGKR